MQPALGLVAALAVSLSPGTAHATSGLHLRVERRAGAEACPDEPALRDAVQARIANASLPPPTERTFSVTYRLAETTFDATIRLLGSDGVARGQRVLHSSGTDCRALLDAVALAISIALQMEDSSPESGPPQPQQPWPSAFDPDDVPQADALPASAPAPPPSVAWSVGAEGGLAFGAAPAPALAGALDLDARVSDWALELDLAALAPATEGVAGGGAVQTWTVGAALRPCRWLGPFEACASVAIDRIEGSGEGIPHPATSDGVFAVLGGRLAVEIPVSVLAIRASANLGAPLQRPSVSIDSVAVWTMPPVSGSVGAGVAFKIP